jgi:hypothetical protein
MAEYHAVERPSERPGGRAGLLGPDERAAVEIRNAAKYLALPYDPPGVEEDVRSALAGPLSEYINLVAEGGVTTETSA